MDGENGLLLTPTVDHLFDRGFISFENNGDVLVSPVAHRKSLKRMGIEVAARVNVGVFSEGQRRHLEFHREAVFLEARGYLRSVLAPGLVSIRSAGTGITLGDQCLDQAAFLGEGL